MELLSLYEEFHYKSVDELDIPYLLNLRKDTMTVYLEKAGILNTEEDHIKRIKFHFDAGKIIFCENKKIGFLKYIEEKNFIHLIQIQIEPQFQNKGFGAKLLDFVIKEGERSNKKIVLEVLKNNPAQRLYEIKGFKIIKEDLFFYQMEKS